MKGGGDARAPIASAAIAALGIGLLVVYALSSGPRAYGHMSDEFYYLECADRLAWGYVDHPPLSIALLALVKETLGTSLLSMRLVPALLACLNVLLVALLTRELGGGRTAQSLAALAAAAAPVYLAGVGFYSMNSFEPAFWSGAALLLARIANDEEPALWIALGVVLGLGLLNKISVLWLGLGLAVGLVATPQRRWLLTPWPYACAAVALLIVSPHLLWQVEHGWPTLEFMRNARELKMVAKSPLDFGLEQLVMLSPAAAPLWLAGIAFYLTGAGRQHRWLLWIWASVIVLLLASGSARSNYSGPAYVVLLAAGGVAIEGFARSGVRRVVPALLALLILAAGLAAAPLAVPLLPPADLVGYVDRLGLGGVGEDEKDPSGLLPLHFSLRFGWRELAEAVERASDSLAPGERLYSVVLAPSFGATGALNFERLQRRNREIPPAVSGHNSYWLWGPGDADGEVIIAVADDPELLERNYRQVELVAEVDCGPYCRPEIERYRVYVCRGLRRSLDAFWQELRHYI